MLIRATFFFQQQGYGWTESYWREGPAISAAAWFDPLMTLAMKRMKLSGANTFMTHARLSEENVFRDAWLYTFSGGGLPGQGNEPSAAPQLALLVRMRDAAGTGSKSTFLRGIWDSVSLNGGQYSPTPAYTGFKNDWQAQLIADGWGWLGRAVQVSAQITNVTASDTGLVVVTTATPIFPAPFPSDLVVRISGVVGATQLNGVRRVRATTTQLATVRGQLAILPYITGGVARYNTLALKLISWASDQRIIERKPGRPSYLSRGRR